MGSGEVHLFLCGLAHPGMLVTRRALLFQAARYNRLDFYQWAIVPREAGRAIGQHLRRRPGRAGKMARFGSCIGIPWQGRGIHDRRTPAGDRLPA